MANSSGIPVGSAPRGRPGGGCGADTPQPLAPSQELLWEFMSALSPHDPAASRELVVDCRRWLGHLDRVSFLAAVTDVAQRHDALRLLFRDTGCDPLVEVTETVEPPVSFLDLAGLSPDERGVRCGQIADAERLRVFDLRAGPLWHVHAIRLAAAEHLLIVTFCHMIADGWSAGLFIEDLLHAYLHRTGRGPALTGTELTFAGAAAMQRALLAPEPSRLDYWQRNLLPLPPYLPLAPPTHIAPDTDLTAEVAHPFRFPAAVAAGLHGVAWRARTTPYIVLMAAYHMLLATLTGTERIVLGTTTLGRPTAASRRVIGQFTNDVHVTGRIRPQDSVLDVIASIHHAMSAAVGNAVRYKALAACINPAFARERPWPDNHLFHSYLQAAVPASPELAVPGLRVRQISLDGRERGPRRCVMAAREVLPACLPVWVKRGAPIVIVDDDRGGGVMAVNRNFFGDDLVRGLIQDYLRIVRSLVEDPGQPVAALRLSAAAAAAGQDRAESDGSGCAGHGRSGLPGDDPGLPAKARTSGHVRAEGRAPASVPDQPTSVTAATVVAAIVAQALADVLGSGVQARDIAPDADLFTDHGLNSMQAISFLVRLEELFDVELEPDLLGRAHLHTVRAVSGYLAARAAG